MKTVPANHVSNTTMTTSKRGIWPGWWIVLNIYLVVIVLLAVAGSAIDV